MPKHSIGKIKAIETNKKHIKPKKKKMQAKAATKKRENAAQQRLKVEGTKTSV